MGLVLTSERELQRVEALDDSLRTAQVARRRDVRRCGWALQVLRTLAPGGMRLHDRLQPIWLASCAGGLRYRAEPQNRPPDLRGYWARTAGPLPFPVRGAGFAFPLPGTEPRLAIRSLLRKPPPTATASRSLTPPVRPEWSGATGRADGTAGPDMRRAPAGFPSGSRQWRHDGRGPVARHADR